jgi:hypothetical protein
VRLALTDLPMALLLAAACFAAESARPKSAAALLAAAALARETALLGAAGLLTRPWISLRHVLLGIFVAAPLFAWLAYIRWRIGPADAGWANLSLPVSGLIEKTATALTDLTLLEDSLLAWTTLGAVVGIAVQAAFFAARWRQFAESWWRVGAAYAALMLTLGTAVWEGYPGAFTRVLLPLTLAFNVLAHRTRAALAWLILGNLGIAAGFLVLRDFPVNTRELSAGRSGGVATVVHTGDGWFGAERTAKHLWSWSSGRSQLVIETWAEAPVVARLDFSLRTLAPRNVIIRQGDRELWRGPVGEKTAPHSISLRLAPGRTNLEFYSETPPTSESPHPDARALAFALYDLRLSVLTP